MLFKVSNSAPEGQEDNPLIEASQPTAAYHARIVDVVGGNCTSAIEAVALGRPRAPVSTVVTPDLARNYASRSGLRP